MVLCGEKGVDFGVVFELTYDKTFIKHCTLGFICHQKGVQASHQAHFYNSAYYLDRCEADLT